MKNVFISHAGADTAIAKQLHDDLVKAGVAVTIDLNSLKLGNNPIDFMNKAIAAADTVLILYSTATPNAKWQMLEIDSALWHNLAQSGGEIIVLRLDSAPLPPLLGPRLFGSLEPQNYAATLKTLLSKTTGVSLPVATILSTTPSIPYVTEITSSCPDRPRDVTWAVMVWPDNRREIILTSHSAKSGNKGQIVQLGPTYEGFPELIEYVETYNSTEHCGTLQRKYQYNHRLKESYCLVRRSADNKTIEYLTVSVDIYKIIDAAEMWQGSPRYKITRTSNNSGGFEDEIFDMRTNEEYQIRIFSSGKRVRILGKQPAPSPGGTRKVPFYSI